MKKETTIVSKYNIPTLLELYNDSESIAKQNKLNIILNAEPKKEWIKEHPFVKGLKYLPIERVEYLLTMIFSKWRVEIKETKILANSITTTVKVWYIDPISGEWDWQDGVGAIPIQTEKGSGALDFDKMNKTSIQMGLPASESFAIKDACEKLGRIFGKDLNRKDNINYDRLYSMIDTTETVNNPTISEELRQLVTNAKTDVELKTIWENNKGLGKEFAKLVTTQREFLQDVKKNENANS